MKSISFAITFIFLRYSSADHPQVHGSGTTNPQNCLALIMQQFQDGAKQPIRLTYRGVGTGTGQTEFLGATQGYEPFSDFGCGDVPLSTKQYNDIVNATGDKVVIHLPFLLGAVSFFHNIPNVPSGSAGLNMTGCLLARIFKRNITSWDDPDIVAINSALPSLLPQRAYPIKVARRVLGSSSTSGITNYFYKTCPEVWEATDVGLAINTWPNETLKCDGSDGMLQCIRGNLGAIGYMESGRGWASDVKEVQLQNLNQVFISSRAAAKLGGITSATVNKILPSSFSDDFGGVEFLNEPGNNTWPIILMSYIYMRNDIYKFMGDANSAGLLKQFLLSLYEPSFINQCTAQYGFDIPADTIRAAAVAAINNISWTDPNNSSVNVTQWVFEIATSANTGQADNVISTKRFTGTGYQLSVESTRMYAIESSIVDIKQNVATLGASLTAPNTRVFTTYDYERARAALVLGALSFCMCIIFVITLIVRRVCCK